MSATIKMWASRFRRLTPSFSLKWWWKRNRELIMVLIFSAVVIGGLAAGFGMLIQHDIRMREVAEPEYIIQAIKESGNPQCIKRKLKEYQAKGEIIRKNEVRWAGNDCDSEMKYGKPVELQAEQSQALDKILE